MEVKAGSAEVGSSHRQKMRAGAGQLAGETCWAAEHAWGALGARAELWGLRDKVRNQQGHFFQAEQLLHPNNQTKFYREFLGIVAGEQLEARGLGEAVQTLCEHTSIFWVRRGHGKWGAALGRGSSSFSSTSKRIRLCCTAADAAQDRDG